MCGESYILALCGGTSGCEGRSCCTLCRCVKVYLADTETHHHHDAAENFTFSRHTGMYSTTCASLYSGKS